MASADCAELAEPIATGSSVLGAMMSPGESFQRPRRICRPGSPTVPHSEQHQHCGTRVIVTTLHEQIVVSLLDNMQGLCGRVHMTFFASHISTLQMSENLRGLSQYLPLLSDHDHVLFQRMYPRTPPAH